MTKLIYKAESYAIIGACFEVHRKLGCGFLEAVYQEALEREFTKRNIPFERQKKIHLYYGEQKLRKYYIADFLCFEKIILEIKSVSFLNQLMKDQLRNYLKATRKELGILVNFGERSLNQVRMVNTSTNEPIR